MENNSAVSTPVEADTLESSRVNKARSDSGPFRLQPDSELPNATSYDLSDLLQFHDRTFVWNAYAAIAKRPPGPAELMQTVDDLRAGRRSKTELVEDLVAKHPQVRIHGLNSSWLRKVSRWPLIGYVLRVMRGVGRLPVLLQHQQQFESYVVGQQQRMADHFNDVLKPRHGLPSPIPHGELAENVSDAIKTLMMLSDSLVELSAQVAESEQQLQSLQAHQGKVEADFSAGLTAMQKQHEQSEAQLHADLVALTNQLSAQQQRLTELRHDQQSAAAAHTEFLVDEERAIVEAQRAAISDLQEQLTNLSLQQETKRAELVAKLDEIRVVVDEFRQATVRK